MRIILFLWAIPMALFWGWYALSVNDWNFGTIFLSKQLHDLVFEMYGRTLGIAPDAVPAAIASASAFDTLAVMALLAWRWRLSWYPQTKAWIAGQIELARETFAAAALSREATARVGVARGAPSGPARPAE